jgi:RNA polymerase sigma factor (sigma-70 family)
VEDVVMAAIEKLVWRLPRLPSPVGNMQNVRALLARITDNAAVDFFRKKCVRETPLVSDEEDGAEPSDPPDERDWERLMRDWVDAKLIGEIAFGDLLTDKEKAVFKGIYLEGLKHREIEEKYGVPVKSVGNTNNHLLAKIRKYLDELESGM